MPRAKKPVSRVQSLAAVNLLAPASTPYIAPHVHTLNECIVCGWPGSPSVLDDNERPRQWATVEHDLCTNPACIEQFKLWSRSGELPARRKALTAK